MELVESHFFSCKKVYVGWVSALCFTPSRSVGNTFKTSFQSTFLLRDCFWCDNSQPVTRANRSHIHNASDRKKGICTGKDRKDNCKPGMSTTTLSDTVLARVDPQSENNYYGDSVLTGWTYTQKRKASPPFRRALRRGDCVRLFDWGSVCQVRSPHKTTLSQRLLRKKVDAVFRPLLCCIIHSADCGSP